MRIPVCPESTPESEPGTFTQGERVVGTGARGSTRRYWWVFLLVAIPFFGVGAYASLVGLGVVPIDLKQVHVPLGVVGLVGAAFLVGGLALLVAGAVQGMAQARLAALARRYPEHLWAGDYDWNPERADGDGPVSDGQWIGIGAFVALAVVGNVV
ncbi:MAG: hypothetical protein ACLFV7_15125, partial [Phycisphaerae bacterium]